MGDALSALRDYQKAITLNSFEPEGYIRRSRIYYAQNRLDEAIADLDNALDIDTSNTFAYFNRALMRYDKGEVQGALDDFEQVLRREPTNALTLYNRALVRCQIGDYNQALEDYDKVLNINPNNVLAYYNRALLFMELGRYRDAMNDFSSAINLYPDFAKAYMNRSYVKNMLGQYTSAEQDYKIAQEKISKYRIATADSAGRAAFADTSKRFDNLLALDSDFARKDFSDELLQHRNVEINLKPLYKFVPATDVVMAELPKDLTVVYDNAEFEKFMANFPLRIVFKAVYGTVLPENNEQIMAALEEEISKSNSHQMLFAKGILESNNRLYNAALMSYDNAIKYASENVFYYINRGVLQSEMIDFISSIESNVQVLSLDDSGNTMARVQDNSYRNYDYTPAIHDMKKAAALMPDFPYVYYNLGNLYCQSGDLPEAIVQYTKALEVFPNLSEAYYNRGLVLIYLKDKEKGCIDMSKAGELGIPEAYSVINKYCVEEK